MQYNNILYSFHLTLRRLSEKLAHFSPQPLNREQLDTYLSLLEANTPSKNTLRNARSILRRFVKYLEGEQVSQIDGITVPLLLGFVADFDNNNYRYNVLYHIEQFLGFLGFDEATNPAKQIERPRLIPGNEKRFLSPNEMKDLFEELEYRIGKGKNLREYVLIQLLTFTGRRINEALHLKKASVQSNGLIHFRDKKAKQNITVLVPPCVIESIQAYHKAFPSSSPYVFYSYRPKTGEESTPLGYSPVYVQLQNIFKSAGIENPGQAFHALRHTYSHALQQAGFGEREVQLGLGQKSSTAVRWYIPFNDLFLQESANRIQEAVKAHLDHSFTQSLKELSA